MGPLLVAVAEGGARRMSYRARTLLDLQYLLFARTPPLRRAAQAVLARLGRRGLIATVERTRPDVVISTYPAVTEVLGHVRARGDVAVPAVALVTDLSSLYYWANAGIDLHLLIHPESVPEVRRLAPGSRVVPVHGLTRPEFLAPPPKAVARRELGLPEDAPVVVVSGGGWGVGDVEGALECALAVDGVEALVLCGRNDELRASVQRDFGDSPRVRVLGFTDAMPAILAAGDCLVHASAGLTVLEAITCGCRPISYGWGVAHIRMNNRAFARHGLADVVTTKPELRAAIERALAAPAEPDRSFARLPAAADEILALAGA
jgi:UDP-N-acetylglucosamine:LPS N-acetylglucosamine transferase